MKIREIPRYFKALITLARKEYQRQQVINNPSILIKSLQKEGVAIDDDVIVFSPETLFVDLTRPSLINVKGDTFLHKNLKILTHDYATEMFLHKYGEFINSSGKVTIGRNVWFGENVTLLKGAEIGDNCIIGYGSVVMGKIPSESVAAGCPARVICTLDEYFQKRKIKSEFEAFEYARSIQERYHRRPIPSDFWEEFPWFVSGNEVDKYPEIPIKKQMGAAFEHFRTTHKAKYPSFDAFLKAAGINNE